MRILNFTSVLTAPAALLSVFAAFLATSSSAVVIVDSSASLKYLLTDTDPSLDNAVWTSSTPGTSLDAFTDSTSATGAYQYGGIEHFTANTITTTDLTPPASGSRFTTYFRIEFTTVSDFNALSLDLVADDGAVVYLDGSSIGSRNFDTIGVWDATPTKTDSFTELALSDSNTTHQVEELNTIDLSYLGTLSAGTHVISFSIHQADSTSSDMGFFAELSGTAVPEPSQYALLLGMGAITSVLVRRKRASK